MALETKTLQEIEELLRAAVRGFIGDADVSALSDYDITVRILAMLFLGNQAQALSALDQAFPRKADAEWLQEHKSAQGLPDLSNTFAGGTVRLTGLTASDVQAAGSALTHDDGTTYTLDSDATMVLPGFTGKTATDGSTRSRLIIAPNTTGIAADDVFVHNGFKRCVKAVISEVNAIDLYVGLGADPVVGGVVTASIGAVGEMTATDVGSQGNKPPGETVDLDAPTADVQAQVTVLEVSGGKGIESTDELRDRVVDWRAARPASGNVEDYRQWARETPEVGLADAFVYPGIRGATSIDVIPFGASKARVTSGNDNTRIATYLATVAPASDDVQIIQLTHDVTPVPVTMALEMREGFEPDWLGTLTVDTASTTLIVKVTTDPTGTVEVNDRILVAITVAGRTLTYLRTVQAVSATDLTVTEALPAAPVAAVVVYPAGPGIADVLAAVETYFDDLGPGTFVAPSDAVERWPLPGELWDHEARRAKIFQAVMNVAGLKDMTLTAPASDTEPASQTKLVLGLLTITYA